MATRNLSSASRVAAADALDSPTLRCRFYQPHVCLKMAGGFRPESLRFGDQPVQFFPLALQARGQFLWHFANQPSPDGGTSSRLRLVAPATGH